MKTGQVMETDRVRFGLLQAGIVVLVLFAAVVHLSLNFPDPVFILNGLGFLGLLAALYLPLPFARDNRRLVRWLLIGYTAVTILAWVAIGEKQLPQGALGYVTALSEVVLVILLWLEGRQS